MYFRLENSMGSGVSIGSIVPDFTLTSLDGNAVSLSDYQGKRIILFCWGSW